MPNNVGTKPIPFYRNHNNKSCGQCVYRMILSHFFPEKDWTIAEIDTFCGAVLNKYTWTYKPVIELAKLGLDVIVYANFDTEEFIKSPKSYLALKYGEDGCYDSMSNSDMPSVMDHAKSYVEFLQNDHFKEVGEYYNIEDVKSLLDQGYLIGVWVNSAKLNGHLGYAGHFVLIHNYTEKSFVAHDPGGNDENGKPKNQIQGRMIKYADLISAASPTIEGETSDLIAIKKRRVEENA